MHGRTLEHGGCSSKGGGAAAVASRANEATLHLQDSGYKGKGYRWI